MIPVLNSRTKNILQLLVESHSPLTLNIVASQFHLSSRQVRYSLNKAKLWLKNEGVIVSSNTKGEILFDLSIDERFRLKKKLKLEIGYKLSLSIEQRIQYEMLRILTDNEPLSLKQLEKELEVSQTSLSRDLDEVSAQLNTKRLKLKSKPNVGIYFSGNELDYRAVLIELLASILQVEDLLEIVRSRGFRTATSHASSLEKVAWEYISQLPVCSVAKKIFEGTKSQNLADMDIIHLLLFLAISCKRICEGHFITITEDNISMISSHWAFRTAQNWVDSLQEELHKTIPKTETAAIAIRLACAKTAYLSPINDVSTQLDLQLSKEASTISNTIIDIASKRLHPLLRIDPLLSHGLIMHIVPVLERLHFGLSIENPVAEEIRISYPEIYRVAKESQEEIKKQVGITIPDDELGYWAMHLGAALERLRARPQRRVLVVCSEGIATAWMLVSRLKSIFPYLEIEDVISIFKLNNQSSDTRFVDAIISTVPLTYESVPVVVVHALLGKEDIEKLSEELSIVPVASQLKKPIDANRTGPGLADLLQPELLKLRSTAKDWEDAVQQAGLLLVRQRIVEPRYVEAMIAQIYRHGPYVVISPGVALAHALPKEGALGLGMSLVTLRDPVTFGHQINDPVDIVFAFACTDMYSHLNAFNGLVDLLDDPCQVNLVRSAGLSFQIQHILRKFKH